MNAGVAFRRLTGPGPALEEVLRIDRACFSHPWTREMYERDLQNDRAFVIVAQLPDGTVAAYCSFWLVLDELHINNIAVRPDCRRQGIGLATLNYALDLGRDLGARAATLEVRAANQAARDLYRAAGFEERGRRRRYYTDPEDDALVLWAAIQEIGTHTAP